MDEADGGEYIEVDIFVEGDSWVVCSGEVVEEVDGVFDLSS